MTDQTKNLADMLSKSEATASLRIGVITHIDTTIGRKVRTDQTGTAWLARDEDARLAVGDRVWMVKQGSTFVVAGRLSGAPATPVVKKKAVAQVIASSITPAVDPSLFYVLTPGQYRIGLYVHYSSDSATADLRSAWTFSGTFVSTARSCFGPGIATTAVGGQAAGSVMRASGHGLATEITYGTDAGINTGVMNEDLLLDVDVAGTLQWTWAQGTSSVDATTVSLASRLYVTPVQFA